MPHLSSPTALGRRHLGWLVTVVTLLGVLLGGCSRPPALHKLEGAAEGTTYHISWWSEPEVAPETLEKRIDQALQQIDLWISNYRDDSLIERFNRGSSTQWQTLPADVVQLLSIARTVHRESRGCYDPTIAPLFDLWGFRADHFQPPSQSSIEATLAKVGFDHLQLDPTQDRVRKTLPELSVDMSSMGEGYTLWRLRQVLEDAGIHAYLIEFGGDMLARGRKPDGSTWKVAIERPSPARMAVERVFEISAESGVSINTSGTYHHFFDEAGHRYSHILDARTGTPVTHDLVSASVIGSDPRLGDAWATAMLCLGQQAGMAVARAQHLAVLFIQQDGDGKLHESQSPALANSNLVKALP
ncbi:FAD:protein FMN transferase [Salinicola endophyticus]|uniref:FAD:protein FMN transferase n=1 Tax=Salinicola endophyticus TaxID=1949083 RepID=A0ABY8FED2_9GAMM|nr:FAD:protein FMN transferase [Salinicola endophyticus]WFF41179.1 FAD:protein FMN transferase [Salinicola endophyticus]